MTAEVKMNDVQPALRIVDDNECQYRIRLMHQTDIDILFAIEEDIWHEESWDHETFLTFFNDLNSKCWIVENTISTTDNPILGYGFQSISDETKRISCITNIAIHPAHQSRGLGGILLRHMIDYARKTNILTVELQVNPSNKHAFQLYINHGFIIVRLLHEYYSELSHAYQMELSLSLPDQIP